MSTDATILGGNNTPSVAAASAIPPAELDRLTDEIVTALKSVYDPEIPADIYELGLIYWVENAVAAVPGIQSCAVTMVFDPPWDQSRMSDEARVALDMW